MNLIIGEEQCAFTKRRMGADNILISHEIMHSLKLHWRPGSYGMVVKLDINKAYDSI